MAERECDHCQTVHEEDALWPHPFDEGQLCTRCLYELQDENEEADEQANA